MFRALRALAISKLGPDPRFISTNAKSGRSRPRSSSASSSLLTGCISRPIDALNCWLAALRSHHSDLRVVTVLFGKKSSLHKNLATKLFQLTENGSARHSTYEKAWLLLVGSGLADLGLQLARCLRSADFRLRWGLVSASRLFEQSDPGNLRSTEVSEVAPGSSVGSGELHMCDVNRDRNERLVGDARYIMK